MGSGSFYVCPERPLSTVPSGQPKPRWITKQVTGIYYVLEGSVTMVAEGTLLEPARTNEPVAGPTNVGTALRNSQPRGIGSRAGHWFGAGGALKIQHRGEALF